MNDKWNAVGDDEWGSSGKSMWWSAVWHQMVKHIDMEIKRNMSQVFEDEHRHPFTIAILEAISVEAESVPWQGVV